SRLCLVDIMHKTKDTIYFLPPFIALLGFYLFNIIGTISVINEPGLFTYKFFFTLLALILSFYLFYFIIFQTKNKWHINWSYTHNYLNSNLIFIAGLWSVCILLFLLYYSRHGLPPVFDINLNEFTNIYLLRGEKWTTLPEGTHWYRVGFFVLPSFIAIYTFILKKLYGTFKYKVIFYVNLLAALIFLSFPASKGQYINLILYFLICNILLRGKQIKLKTLLSYILGVIVSIFILLRIYLFNRETIEVITILPKYIFGRIFADYSKAHAYLLQIFPSKHEYLWGHSFINPGGIFPLKSINISNLLGFYVNRQSLENYSSPSYSQGYVNFGIWGIFLVFILMFMQLLIFQYIFKKLPKNPLLLTIYIIFLGRLLGYANQGIHLIFPEQLVLVFGIIFIFYYLLKEIEKFVLSIKN
ncbi:O-antigen polymerase, partial [Candidatus Margulisiibacteriota bacterium]